MTDKKPLITIVDDDESVCRALERLARSLGMAAETCTGGVVGFLRKPCNDALIIRTLKAALKRSRADKQSDGAAGGNQQS